jgi:hypothetical protein
MISVLSCADAVAAAASPAAAPATSDKMVFPSVLMVVSLPLLLSCT